MDDTFEEIFQALKPSYRSVDVRGILLATGAIEGWRCAATIIRLSDRSPEDINQAHQQIVKNQRLPDELMSRKLGDEWNLQPFRGMNLELSAYPIEDFWNLFKRFDNGLIDGRSRAFHVFDPDQGMELRKEKVSRRFDAYATDDGPWEVYYLGRGQLANSWLSGPNTGGTRSSVHRSDLDRWAREIGQPDYRSIFERVLGVPYGPGETFELRAPIYARIDDMICYGGLVRVKGRRHTSLGQLSVECSFYSIGDHGSRFPLPSTPASIDLIGEVGSPEISTFSEEFTVDSAPDMGVADATIYKRNPIRVDLFQKSARLRSAIPLYRTYIEFVPEKDVTDLLSRLVAGTNVEDCRFYTSFKPKDSSKKMDEVIEYLTHHLLALCQLNPILLSNPQYDVLFGDLSAGSADILATTPMMDPMLVSCTMAMPDVRKAGMLTAARTAVSSRIRLPEDRIKMLLVTGKPTVSEDFPNMRVLGAEDLTKVWEALQLGNIAEARQILGVES